MFNILMATTEGNGKSGDSKGFIPNFDFAELWKSGKLTTVSTLYLGFFIAYLLFLAILMVTRVESTTWLHPEDVRLVFLIAAWAFPIVLVAEGVQRYLEYKSNEAKFSAPIKSNGRKPRK